MTGFSGEQMNTSPVTGDASGLKVPALFLLFVGALAAMGPLTMDLYLPALPTIADYFSVDVASVSATVSTYLLGYAIGQFFGGPISDQVGRKTIGVTGLLLYLAATLGIVFAGTVEQTLVWRFLQALGGGSATVLAMALVRDIYSPIEAGKRFALVMMVVMIAPLAGPAAGTYLLHFGWHAIFWLFAVYALALCLSLLLFVPETHPNPKRSISLSRVFRQYGAVIRYRINGRRIAIRFPIAMAFSGGVMMIFVTQSAAIYLEHFQTGETLFPLLFGANIVVLASGNLASARLLGRINPQTLFRSGILLQLLAIGSLFLVVLLGLDRLYVVVPLIMLGVGSIGLTNPSGMTIFMSYFPRGGGSASAVFTTLMFSLGGVLGSLPNLFPGHGLLPTVSVMLGSTLVANLIGQAIPPVQVAGAVAG